MLSAIFTIFSTSWSLMNLLNLRDLTATCARNIKHAKCLVLWFYGLMASKDFCHVIQNNFASTTNKIGVCQLDENLLHLFMIRSYFSISNDAIWCDMQLINQRNIPSTKFKRADWIWSLKSQDFHRISNAKYGLNNLNPFPWQNLNIEDVFLRNQAPTTQRYS